MVQMMPPKDLQMPALQRILALHADLDRILLEGLHPKRTTVPDKGIGAPRNVVLVPNQNRGLPASLRLTGV